jgi:thiamine phosphate synthase YjbQ (UPF0047 family)
MQSLCLFTLGVPFLFDLRLAVAFSPRGNNPRHHSSQPTMTTPHRDWAGPLRQSSSSTQKNTGDKSCTTIPVNIKTSLGAPICEYHQIAVPTSQQGPPRQAISVEDLTPIVKDLLRTSGMKQGVVHVISRHTTTAITINERESRLADDMAQYFLQLVPPDERSSSPQATAGVRYFHNDIDQRPDSAEEAQRCRENGWDIDNDEQLQAWRAQEPISKEKGKKREKKAFVFVRSSARCC